MYTSTQAYETLKRKGSATLYAIAVPGATCPIAALSGVTVCAPGRKPIEADVVSIERVTLATLPNPPAWLLPWWNAKHAACYAYQFAKADAFAVTVALPTPTVPNYPADVKPAKPSPRRRK
jgi:hypothetical protein